VTAKVTGGVPGKSNEELLNDVIVDLIRRKTAKPRTSKTLINTIHARCGKELAVARIEAIYKVLLKRGIVKLEGTKVSYNLPSEPKPVKPHSK
jgi:hypothetical protein